MLMILHNKNKCNTYSCVELYWFQYWYSSLQHESLLQYYWLQLSSHLVPFEIVDRLKMIKYAHKLIFWIGYIQWKHDFSQFFLGAFVKCNTKNSEILTCCCVLNCWRRCANICIFGCFKHSRSNMILNIRTHCEKKAIKIKRCFEYSQFILISELN